MNIHEYQGKELFRKYGVATPRGFPAFSVEEAVAAAKKLGGPVWVVKAQIHAGGRGKGGGVKLARSVDEVRSLATKMLGMTLVTHQTGPQGRVVRRLLIEEGADIRKELYAALVVDRVLQRVVLMASSEGGMDIEEVAARTPERIHKVAIDPMKGLEDAQAEDIATKIGVAANLVPQARDLFKSLYKCFDECDCSLVEVNPLIVTGDGRVVALDAKLNFDDNALFRHPDIVAMRDLDEEDPAEVEASKFDLNYIQLDGDIGCLVNGAGLAMATMDTIKLFGGRRGDHREGDGSLQDHAQEPEARGDPREHLRRHHEVRRDRERCGRRGEAGRAQGAARRPPRGHQRRPRQEDPRRLGPPHHFRERHGRCREEGRRRRQGRRGRRVTKATTCPSSSTGTPRSSRRASPARPASSTRRCAAITRTAGTASSRA